MPAMGIDLRLFERGGKPSAPPLEGIPRADEREDGVDSRPAFPALQLLERGQGDGIPGNGR